MQTYSIAPLKYALDECNHSAIEGVLIGIALAYREFAGSGMDCPAFEWTFNGKESRFEFTTDSQTLARNVSRYLFESSNVEVSPIN